MERSFVRSAAVEKRELSKIDFEMIDDAFKALLQSSHPDPVVEAKIVDLRDSLYWVVGDRRGRVMTSGMKPWTRQLDLCDGWLEIIIEEIKLRGTN
jgi:hypothetical protein